MSHCRHALLTLGVFVLLSSPVQGQTNPVAWKMLILVYPEVDATYIDEDGASHYIAHSMAPADYQFFLSVLDQIPATIADWSAGRAEVQTTIVTVNEPIRSLNANGEPSEYQARAEIDRYNPGGIYDSIMMVYSLHEGWVAGVASVGTTSAANGAGFGVIHLPINYSLWDLTYPEEIVVHEWLHNVEGFYRGLGYSVPGLHDGELYGYAPDPNFEGSWHQWYRDYMQHQIWTGTEFIGVPLDAWQSHVPTGPVTYPPPPAPVPVSPMDGQVDVPASVPFAWNAAPEAAWHELEVATDPGFAAPRFRKWVNAEAYTLTDLQQDTVYFFRVRAVNAAGASPWSPVRTFVTEQSTTIAAGSAMRFDGVNDHVRVPRMVAADFTLEAWIKTSSSLPGYHAWQGRGLIYADVPGPGFDFGTAVVDGKLAFTVGDTVTDTTVHSISDVAIGDWVHVAVTRDASAGVMKVFVNGVEENARSGVTSALLEDPTHIDLGGNLVDRRCFEGLIDEVRIWDVARSEGEIASTMNRRLPGSTLGLVGYWRLDEVVNTFTPDASSGESDGAVRYGPSLLPSLSPISEPAADFDLDGDVDLSDFTILAVCLNGPDTPANCELSPRVDLDRDGDIDLHDAASFQVQFAEAP